MVAIKSSDVPIVIKEVDAVAWMDSSNNILQMVNSQIDFCFSDF